MLIEDPLSFIKEFIDELNDLLIENDPNGGLSYIQRTWLSFCLTGVIVTNSVCWARFERASLGKYSLASLSWMFRRSKIIWEGMLNISVKIILSKYAITEGVLVIDETDKKRSKSTKKIYGVHKIKDKTSGGYMKGQSITVLLLVSSKVTIPVGFSFYVPDPKIKEWRKREKQLKAQGVPKKKRPSKPESNPEYPCKHGIGLNLLEEFKDKHPQMKVKLIVADGYYGNAKFMNKASDIFNKIQVISKLRRNQNIRFRNKKRSVESYFSKRQGVVQKIKIRGQERTVTVDSARLYVKSHKTKRFVVALKYEGEEEYRYLVASDLSWRTLDIVQGYTLRMLVEVFFQDWKSYEGWGQLTKQTDFEGSSRGLILSLLLDHCLLFHHEQKARLENKLPPYTVGSLREKAKVECLLEFIRKLVTDDNPEERIDIIVKTLEDVFELKPSRKHMVNEDFERLAPAPSLKWKAKKAA